MKIVVFGAGSFVFGPSVLQQIFGEHEFPNLELALVDLDAEMVGLMAGVARRLAEDAGVRATITTHADRRDALPGADFVICAVAVQMLRRFAQDSEIIRREFPTHLITEFGGVAGIAYSLRQIAMIRGLCANMRELCPNARLLSVSNPLPRVVQAANDCGVESYGFCSVSLNAYRRMERLFHGNDVGYPFAAPRERWDITIGGVNHLCWMLEFRDRATGRDLLPELRARLDAGATSGQPLTEEIFRQTGYWTTAGDTHIHDFLPPTPHTSSVDHTSHGTADDRAHRVAVLQKVARRETEPAEAFGAVAWEKPIDLIAGLTGGTPTRLHSLNAPNRGAATIPGLPENVLVESAATVDASGIRLDPVTLPSPVLALCQRTAAVSNAIVRAGVDGSVESLREAVELDPTILDKDAGWRTTVACVRANADLIPPELVARL